MYSPLITTLFITLTTLIGCSSTPKDKAETLNTQIENAQSAGGKGQIGLNNTGELVHQEKQLAAQTMVNLENEVMQLQDEVYGTARYKSEGLYGKLKTCRKERAMKTGKLTYIPEKSPILAEDQPKIGIESTTGDYISFSNEKLNNRMTRFSKYKTDLLEIKEELEEFLDKCQIAK